MNAEQWKQVKEIFSEAVELPHAERLVFIEQKSGGDELIIREVHALLESDEEAEDFIENPLAAVSHLVRDEMALAGKKVGAYKIEKEIGRGGMGAVYLASRADKEFEKRVALKLIKRGFDTDEIIKRFRYERQILAALDHPNITRLLDGGATEDGLPFLLMDYVEGLPLNRFCEENELSVNERLKLFSANLFGGDLRASKPDNSPRHQTFKHYRNAQRHSETSRFRNRQAHCARFAADARTSFDANDDS